MIDKATHIRLIRDRANRPVRAIYLNAKDYHWRKFAKWAAENLVEVAGDWPEDDDLFEISEVEYDDHAALRLKDQTNAASSLSASSPTSR